MKGDQARDREDIATLNTKACTSTTRSEPYKHTDHENQLDLYMYKPAINDY